jgi:hypothetical protein
VKHISTVLLLVLFLMSWNSALAEPRLSSVEAIRLAEAAATRQGYDLRAYHRPPGWNYTVRENLWRVFYYAKQVKGARTPAKDLAITVADQTKKTTVRVKR